MSISARIGSAVFNQDSSNNTFPLDLRDLIPLRQPLVINHPRPDSEAEQWEQHRHCINGEEHRIQCVAEGGVYPLYWRLDTAPSGATIGGASIGEFSGPTFNGVDFVEPADYGEIVIPAAQTDNGVMTVSLTVMDTLLNTASVTFTIDPDPAFGAVVATNGNDSTGDGTVGNPFASYAPLNLANGRKKAYFRTGTYLFPANYRTNSNTVAPMAHAAYPGETARLDFSQGYFQAFAGSSGASYEYLELFMESNANYGNGQKMLNPGGSDRTGISRCRVVNFSRGGGSNNNPGILVTPNGGGEWVRYCYNTHEGQQGAGFHTFQARHSVVQGNVWENCTFTEFEASNHAIVFYKENGIFGTVRMNRMLNNNYTGMDGFGFRGQGGGATDLLFEYNKCDKLRSARSAAFRLGTNLQEAYTRCHISRNSMASWNTEIPNPSINSDCTRYRNIITNGTMGGATANFTDTGNIEGQAVLDAQMNLIVSQHSVLLGLAGAQVAGEQ